MDSVSFIVFMIFLQVYSKIEPVIGGNVDVGRNNFIKCEPPFREFPKAHAISVTYEYFSSGRLLYRLRNSRYSYIPFETSELSNR
jgi:hypothetical protein